MRPLAFLREVIRMAVGDLAARPLRSVLSVASLSSGIAIAVVLAATGGGLRRAVGEMLRSMGEGQIVATPGRTTGIGGQRKSGRPVRLRYEDVTALEPIPSLAGIAPYYDLRGGGASSWRYSIPYSPARAVAREYIDVRAMPIVEGRWFTAEEEADGKWVAVLNEGLRDVIFPGSEAVGHWIEWRDRRMTVVGVVRDEALFPYIFFVPYRTANQMSDTRYISGLVTRPAPGESWGTAVADLRRVLAGLAGFDPSDRQAIEIEDNREFTGKVRAATAALNALVITIALVCLLLGGLGVANMMVISVTERTREIGLRKALGATPRGIFVQFLCEAVAIVLAGGAAGIALGAAGCAAVGRLEMSATYAARVSFDPEAAFVSLAGLALAGILAGTIPARRAAALTAAEALRWE
jgi:putative ABC transport system permease protein